MARSEVLRGGGLTAAIRIEHTVRRPTGWWTPAVHALLRHLEQVGFEGAPRVLGIDEQGREILSFIPGDAGTRVDDAGLVAAGRLIRRFHEATVGFRAPVDARWQFLVGAPEGGDIVCHNDLSPWNMIWGPQGPHAFVDWDLAAPGSRLWDLGARGLAVRPPLPGRGRRAVRAAAPHLLRRLRARERRRATRRGRATTARPLRDRPRVGKHRPPRLG